MDKLEAVDELRKILKPGDTVYTIVRHVSASGMTRRIDAYVIQDSKPRYLSGYIGIALGIRRDLKRDGLIMSGCGMNMAFELVYLLGRELWPGGFAPSKIGKRPADGKRVNVDVGRGRNAGPLTALEIDQLYKRGWRFECGRNGDTSGWDNDGGYALRQEAL